MHKSGTTMLSETLHKSGINMGDFDESLNYYGGQKYERVDISHAIWDVLDCREKHSSETIPPFSQETILSNIDNLKQLIHEHDISYQDWGYKEPRTIFVYDYLSSSTPEHKIICVYRHPYNVVLHYLQFKLRLKKALKALKAWKAYNEKMIDIVHATDQEYILLNYNDFVKKKNSVKILSDFVGINLKDLRKPKTKRVTLKVYLQKQVANLIMTLNPYDWRHTYKKLEQLYLNQNSKYYQKV